ncbi:Ankyrin repeat domain-containing protein 23 (Diabetes-related ankyrin repeat protein) (Muscle ankyrin repeat protein 3) [Durusdinium trenchii]
MPSMPSMMPSNASCGSGMSDHGRRLDGTNPRGSESGDLRPTRAAVPELEGPSIEAAKRQDDLLPVNECENGTKAMPGAGCAVPSAHVGASQVDNELPSIAPEEELATAGPERREVPSPAFMQDNHVSEPEALPAAASPLGSGTLSPMSPVQEHYVDHQRLPQFGGPGVCDEEMELEKTDPAEAEAPDFAGWYGWTVVATSEGRLFFFHEAQQVSQWHQPTDLNCILGVWKEACDETQASKPIFWRNDLLGISLWRDPRETSNIFQAAMDGNLFFLQLYTQVNGDLDCTDHRECSALHYACAGGSAPSTLFLLQQRAMVDRTDVTLTTPLMLACRYGYAGVLKVLLDAQANPGIADSQGQSPLHQAADLGQLDCLHLLLLCGAQAHQQNHQGETALDIAQRKRHLHCMTLLRRHIHLAEGQRISAVNQQRMLQFSEAVPEKEEMHKEAWMPMPEAESAPWVSAYQEVAANDLIGFDRYAETEVRSSSSDNSDNYTEGTDTSPRHYRQPYRSDVGLLSTLRRRLFPVQADLGLPNQFRFNKATQRWELP